MKPHRRHSRHWIDDPVLTFCLFTKVPALACHKSHEHSSGCHETLYGHTTTTPTAMLTPTPKVSPLGTSLLIREDGSESPITRSHGRYRDGLSSGWLAIGWGNEYYAAWETQVTQKPNISGDICLHANLDPKVFRMGAFDIRPDHILNDNVSNIDVSFREGDTSTLNAIKANEINHPPPLRKYKLLSWGF